MKKIIQLLFIIIFAILLSGAVAHAIIYSEPDGSVSQYGETSRGVPVHMGWSGGIAWGDDKWFNDMSSNQSVYCAQHGGSFFTSKQVEVKIEGTVTASDGTTYPGVSSVSTDPAGAKSASGSINIQFADNGLKDRPESYKIELNATSYPGMNKGSISAACGSKTVTGDNSATIYTTGVTKFSGGGGGGGTNTAMAYILAETSRNIRSTK